ncbi:DNA methyltransferase [Acidovorax sp. Root219]|uniref:class I SAM-dependent DNA methyltransferase n=1 Tax=Acidovorax sp. Root219 TaxID=1736493 RepID=UPI00070E2394|nr:DNA methyltransferase [Acidovorax sp. Root219]KRC29036.1 lactate dehydrogenase [Acidovorax sp. Root219]
MNAVEIEQAISELALQPFDAAEFPFTFLAAFGNKDTTLKRLRTGNNNVSDVPGGVLLRNNIHLAVCAAGAVGDTLKALRSSLATTKAKAKFILATDGQTLEAEELASGETIASAFADFPNHFGFLLPLAGISTIKEIKDNPIDVRATGRLNKLYVELLRENPAWATDERRSDVNHFMARLVFCFFAEDTGIFSDVGLFTQTVDRWSERSGGNAHEVLSEIFRAMNIKPSERGAVTPRLPAWANSFPYVNGGLFSGSTEVPRFTQMARTYLLHAGVLNWREINPDIFGSMIQAVADDEERGSLGMHYTSVPNILKVLNPLFLDDLRTALAEAGDNDRKLLNLRKRMARIRVFDPACGSGNFLVIAYKQMREIEAEINRRRGELHLGSEIPLTNFRGIELRSFPAEIARLALIIAEFQCDVLYRGQKDALAEFLPLDAQNWIVCGNALRLDWLRICPPSGTGVRLVADDLFGTPLDQAQIDFENEGGETYICGNPPYVGDKKQSKEQKGDMESIFVSVSRRWRSFDYVCGFFFKAAKYVGSVEESACAFVSTNSVTQGVQVSEFWPLALDSTKISFAIKSFKWSNLASNNAGVICVVIGICPSNKTSKPVIFEGDVARKVEAISPYMIAGEPIYVRARPKPLSAISEMLLGNFAKDGGELICDHHEISDLDEIAKRFLRPMFGGQEFIKGISRFCFWISEGELAQACKSETLLKRFDKVRANRLASPKPATAEWSSRPHRFVEIRSPAYVDALVIPIVSSENREFLPVGFLPRGSIVNYAFGMYDAPIWNMSLVASRLHLVWIATVCGKMKTDFRYSNTLGWNTFPVPLLTEQNKADLTRCAEDILLAREAHFPSTIADLYDPETMPDNLRHAHERNDEVLERIYIGRRFKNDTERLEKLFELYTKMATAEKIKPASKAAKGRKKTS